MSTMSREGEPMDVDDRPSSVRNEESPAPEGGSEPEAPTDLMVVSRSRRSNAGNRMSTLIAKSAGEEVWGEEWEDAPNEEDFVGDDANDQEDFNLDSSSSEDEDGGDDDDAGEKELRKVERQERIKKRKPATNPFTARLAAATRKRVRLDVPSATESPSSAPRPKKKSERASWIPTEEDGPIRTSSRRQTVANKESTMAKLKEKDKRRDDTLSMMKAAEARKAKDQPKPLTQAERLAEAARVEKKNSKSLHRWEEEEELRAAERQAKIDAFKNRQIDGPFIRYYSGPAIWVDDKIKYTGKDAPSLESVEKKENKETPVPTAQDAQLGTGEQLPDISDLNQTSQAPLMPSVSQAGPTFQIGSQQAVPNSQSPAPDASTGSQSMAFPNTIMFAPPENTDPFLYGMQQYAQPQSEHPTSQLPFQVSQSELPPNPFLFNSPFSQAPHPSLNDRLFSQDGAFPPPNLLSQFQKPAPVPPPPRKKVIRRALRNLIILCSYANLDSSVPTSSSSRIRTTASLLKDKDRNALIQLSTALFQWSQADATIFVTAMLNAPKSKKEKESLARPKKELCAVTNQDAKYRDPGTGIAYRDSKAFGVLRGVVGGGFVWCGEAGCFVGGRAKPMVGMGKGYLGMPPVRGVPERFLEMQRVVPRTGAAAAGGLSESQVMTHGGPPAATANVPHPPPANTIPAEGGEVQQPVKVEGNVLAV